MPGNRAGGLTPLTHDELEQMHAAAMRVLDEIGLQVVNVRALAQLRAAGARVDGDRVHFEPDFVEEHLTAMKQDWPSEPAQRDGPLTINVGDMCQYYHNPHNDQIELMTTANCAEATRAVEHEHSGIPVGAKVDLTNDAFLREPPYSQRLVPQVGGGCRAGARNLAFERQEFHRPTSSAGRKRMADQTSSSATWRTGRQFIASSTGHSLSRLTSVWTFDVPLG